MVFVHILVAWARIPRPHRLKEVSTVQLQTKLYKRLCPSVGQVGQSVTLKLKSTKTRNAAPAHTSTTGSRVSGLVPTCTCTPTDKTFHTSRHTISSPLTCTPVKFNYINFS